jgi:hypothetical protein
MLALALPAQAQTADRTPPTVDVDANGRARCTGEQLRVTVRVTDRSSTRAIVRIDGRRVKSSTRKRFSVRPQADAGAHTIRTAVRDRHGNRFVHTLNLRSCR